MNTLLIIGLSLFALNALVGLLWSLYITWAINKEIRRESLKKK